MEKPLPWPWSPADYRKLKTVLIEASVATEEVADKGDEDAYREVERLAAERTLAALVSFFNRDPELREAGALAVLSRVRHTLYDLQSGRRPPAANPSAKQSDGRPTGRIADRVRAVLSMALDLLVLDGGIKTDTAAAWLAEQADKMAVRCEDGTAVTGRQLVRWRSGLKCGDAPRESRQSFNTLEEAWRLARAQVRVSPPAVRRAAAEQAARRILLNLSNWAPHDAPAERR